MPATARPAPKRRAEAAATASARAGSVSNTRELPDAEAEQRMRHGRAGAARAELHHPVALGVRQAARKPSAKPEQSVLWPMRLPSRSTTVFTAPERPRVRPTARRSSGITACLQGWVMLSPAKPVRSAAASNSGSASAPSPSRSRSISR